MVINPIVGVYIPIIRIPIKAGIIPILKKTRLLTLAQMDVALVFLKSSSLKPWQVWEVGKAMLLTETVFFFQDGNVHG